MPIRGRCSPPYLVNKSIESQVILYLLLVKELMADPKLETVPFIPPWVVYGLFHILYIRLQID